jgi:hypothetical protein
MPTSLLPQPPSPPPAHAGGASLGHPRSAADVESASAATTCVARNLPVPVAHGARRWREQGESRRILPTRRRRSLLGHPRWCPPRSLSGGSEEAPWQNLMWRLDPGWLRASRFFYVFGWSAPWVLAKSIICGLFGEPIIFLLNSYRHIFFIKLVYVKLDDWSEQGHDSFGICLFSSLLVGLWIWLTLAYLTSLSWAEHWLTAYIVSTWADPGCSTSAWGPR